MIPLSITSRQLRKGKVRKMNKKVKNIVLTLCFFITAIFCVNVSANAESYKAYTISSQNTRVYSNTALTSPKGWIYGSDEVTVLDIGNTYCYVRYPISGGKTKEGYISFSSLFTASRGSLYTSRAMITTYRRPGGSSYGSVYKNDSVLVMGTSGSYTQIRYPVSGGYKFAFIRTSDCNSYIKPAASQNRSVYNDVFASTKGKGYNLSQARSSSSTSFTKGQFIYIWGYLHDANDNLYKSFGSGTCNMTLSIYKPDGSCAFSYEYKNSDNNWIGHQLDVAGTWKIQSRITGSLSGTNTQTITVRDTQSPTSYSTTYYVTTTAGLILRKGPGTGYEKILTMPYASSLMVASVSGGWAKAKYNGYEGYCSSSYISKTKPYQSTNVLVSESEIKNAASRYGIGSGSNAYQALLSINTKYYSKLSGNKSGTNIFLFEGVGNNSSAGQRMNAMCVVVSAGKIIYINKNCSTIPDYPFNPSKNDGTAMPTIKDGVYSFTTVNHHGSYAALNISGAKVLRFNSRSSYYSSTSSAINVHRRSSDSIAPSNKSWVNSAGCQLVGKYSEYLSFIRAIGIVSGNSVTRYTNYTTGKMVIDRSFAYSYLSNVGYSANAIALIRG